MATTTLTPSPTATASRPSFCLSPVKYSPLVSAAIQKNNPSSSKSRSSRFFPSSSNATTDVATAGKVSPSASVATGCVTHTRQNVDAATQWSPPGHRRRQQQQHQKQHSIAITSGMTSVRSSNTSSAELIQGSTSPSLSPQSKACSTSPIVFPSPLHRHVTTSLRSISGITSPIRDTGSGSGRSVTEAPSIPVPSQRTQVRVPEQHQGPLRTPRKDHDEAVESKHQKHSSSGFSAGAAEGPPLAHAEIEMTAGNDETQPHLKTEQCASHKAGERVTGDAQVSRKLVDKEAISWKESHSLKEAQEVGRTTAPFDKKPRVLGPAPKVMPIKYETCDVHDLGLLIADMLMELVQLNDGIPLKDGQLTRFHSRAPPTISFRDYLIRLIVHATLSPPLLLSMVYYIDRLCALYPAFTISSLTVHRFLITAAAVAAKGLGDSFWTNSTYARVGGVSIKELALLELELLKRLEWRIVPKPEVLVDYYKSLIDRSSEYILEQEIESTSDDEK